MKKSDIKNGMHVITNNGIEYVVISGVEATKQMSTADTIMVQIGGNGWMSLDKYNDNLRYYESEDERGDEDFDISEVYAPNFYAYVLSSVYSIEDIFIKLWERPIAKKMTKAEIEAELGYEIEIVED